MAWENGIPEHPHSERKTHNLLLSLNKCICKVVEKYLFNSPKMFNAHLRRIPIAHFLVISQAPLPDPALASSGGQLTSPQDTMGSCEGPSLSLSLLNTVLSHRISDGYFKS